MREGGREGGREGEREAGMKGERKGEREEGREGESFIIIISIVHEIMHIKCIWEGADS